MYTITIIFYRKKILQVQKMLRQSCDSSNKTDQIPYEINQERKKRIFEIEKLGQASSYARYHGTACQFLVMK